MHDRRAPAAEVFVGEMEFGDARMFRQQRVNGASQVTDAFAVNDSHPQNPARPTLREIVGNQILDFVWTEGVQVQHTVNRQLDGFIVVHALRIQSPFHRETKCK